MTEKILSFLKCYFLKIFFMTLIIPSVILYFLYAQDIKDITYYPTENLLTEKYSGDLEKKADYIGDKNVHLKYNDYISNKFLLDFTFIQKDNAGIQNIFQTDNFNSGIRLEINNNNLSLIVSDDQIRYKTFLFKTKISQNIPYSFKIHAVDSYGFYAQFNDEIIKYHSYGFKFSGSNFIVGNGYDNTRSFLGVVENLNYASGFREQKFYLKLFVKKYFAEILTLTIWSVPLFLILILFSLKNNINKINSFQRICSTYYNNINYYSRTKYNLNLNYLFKFLFITPIFLIFFFVPAYFYFAITYFALFFIGIGFYVTLLPDYARDDNYALCIVPVFGLLATTIIGGYIITLNFDIKYLLFALPIYSAIILFFSNTRLRYFEIFNSVKNKISMYNVIFIYILIAAIFFLLLPFIIYPESSFYRIGPDLSLYAKMVQYVVDGGLLSEAQQRINEFKNMPVGEINKLGDATATWPFMYFFRWGLASIQSLILFVTPASHVFQVSFLSLIFSHLFLGFIVFYWLHKIFNISKYISLLAAFAVIFNSNLLNLWYEGFYANSYSLYMYLFLIFLIIWKNPEKTSFIKYDLIPVYTFLFLAILLTYPEGLIFILAPLMALILVFEILIYKKIYFSVYSTIVISFILAFLLLLPSNFLIDWAIITFKQLSNEGGNGFMQPHWSLPHEILGIYNIYVNIDPTNAGIRFGRSVTNYIISFSLSIIILATILYYIKNNFRKITPTLYCSYILVGIVAVLVFTFSRANNYLYMKYYVFMAPILLITFWVAIDYYLNRINIIKLEKKYFIYTLITLVIMINGIGYIAKYTYHAQNVSQEKIELYEETKNINFDKTIFYPYSYNNILYSYASLIDVPWIIKDKYNPKYYNIYSDYKVYIFLKADDYKSDLNKEEIIFENKDYMIFDSGLKFIDIIDNKKNIIKEDIFINYE